MPVPQPSRPFRGARSERSSSPAGKGLGSDFPIRRGCSRSARSRAAPLFQILFEKVLALGRRYGSPVPLYLMTSPATHDETIAYLDEKRRFGLPADDVHPSARAKCRPSTSATGRLLLEKQKIRSALSPDGHGGMLAALAKSGGLADMRRRGLEHVLYFQVDNPLAEIADPEFLGYHC